MLDDAPHSTQFPASQVAASPAEPTSRHAVKCAARQLWAGPRSSHQVGDIRLRRLAQVIEANPDDWSAIRRGIDSTQLSAAYLSVRFRGALGMPMRSFALWMKFEQACALVLEGRTPGDAALEAGFADQSHMGRAARRFVGKSFRRALSDLETRLAAHRDQGQQAASGASTRASAPQNTQPASQNEPVLRQAV